MRIGIDARVLDKGITGTGRCLENLLKEIPKIDDFNNYYIFSNKHLDINKKFYNHIIYKAPPLPSKIYSYFWLHWTLPKLLRLYKIDVLFSPNILLPTLKKGEIKCISVIHDVFPFALKEYYSKSYRYYLSILLPKTLRKADKIITSSEYSKNEISRIFNIAPNKIEVIFSCIPNNFIQRKNNGNKTPKSFIDLNQSKKYLLYVGAIEKRKNLFGLIKIFDQLKENGSDLDLIIVGKPGYGYNDISKKIKKREHYIKCLNFVDDELLYFLYKNAFAFLFPSYYEGFGIPPLEAMQLGIPVLSSNTSSLLEVVGEGGLLHNPVDYVGFVNDILNLEKDDNFYYSMKEKALIQAEKFNLQNETQKLLNIFNAFDTTRLKK
jgi:glycosyltransferase involved in cell wall biosynthesis